MNHQASPLVWLGGYRASTVARDDPEDVEPIAKIGAAVLFAAVIAMANWGVAGWVYLGGADPSVRLVVAVLTAILGAAMVLVFDRGFIYFSDTSGSDGRIRRFAYGLFRTLVVLAIGSITSQAIMPLMLADELNLEALRMSESKEGERLGRLIEQYQIKSKEEANQALAKDVERLEKARTQLPLPIQQRLEAAKRCWDEYRKRTASLRKSGYSQAAVRAKLSEKASLCNRNDEDATKERDAYLSQVRAQLTQAFDNKLAAGAELAKATAHVQAKMDQAAQIETESLNPRSSIVLWSLVSRDPGALAKWALISFLLLVCELSPLLHKLQAGQSNVGRRIFSTRRLRWMEITEQLAQREHQLTVFKAVNAASRQAVDDAIENAEVRAIFAQAFAAHIAAIAPTEAVTAMMRDLEARHVDVEDFMQRFPRYATLIAAAWTRAVRQTAAILAGGPPAATAVMAEAA
jgi:hypothetical protein